MTRNKMKFSGIYIISVFVIASFLINGLSAAKAIQPSKKNKLFRGELRYGHEVRSFTDYATNREYWVVNSTGNLLWDIYSQLIGKPYDPVYVEVLGYIGPTPKDGFSTDYNQQITITKLRRASPVSESARRKENFYNIEFRAQGNEPFWNVTIATTGIIFSKLDGPENLKFPYHLPQNSQGKQKYTSSIKKPENHQIEVVIEERPSFDSMSGAYFSFTATVKFDTQTYTGCALEGWK